MRKLLVEFHKDITSQDTVEYALLAALIALAATIGMTQVASDINNAFAAIGRRLNSNVGT